MSGASATWMLSGSSPRVRGKGDGGVGVEELGGIIPAGAGKRARVPVDGGGKQDHPRGCGEKEPRDRAARLRRGSSPRVRGKGW